MVKHCFKRFNEMNIFEGLMIFHIQLLQDEQCKATINIGCLYCCILLCCHTVTLEASSFSFLGQALGNAYILLGIFFLSSFPRLKLNYSILFYHYSMRPKRKCISPVAIGFLLRSFLFSYSDHSISIVIIELQRDK